MALSSVSSTRQMLHCRSTLVLRRCRAQTITPVTAYLTKHSSQQLQATVMRFVGAVNSHDVGTLSACLAPDVVWSDRVWSSVDLRTVAKVQRVYKEWWEAYPDLTLHAEDLLARDDANTVALHFVATGTNFGEWRGFPASGRRSNFSGVTLFCFDQERDDKICQIITYRQPTQEEYIYHIGHEEL